MRLVIEFMPREGASVPVKVELPLGPAKPGITHYPCSVMVVADEPDEKLVEYSRTLIVGPKGALSLSAP